MISRISGYTPASYNFPISYAKPQIQSFGTLQHNLKELESIIVSSNNQIKSLTDEIHTTIENCFKRPLHNYWLSEEQNRAMRKIDDCLARIKTEYSRASITRNTISKILEAQNLTSELKNNQISAIKEQIAYIQIQIFVAERTDDNPNVNSIGGLSKCASLDNLRKQLEILKNKLNNLNS